MDYKEIYSCISVFTVQFLYQNFEIIMIENDLRYHGNKNCF